jgi:nitroreductase
MQTFDNIFSRRSVRAFTNQPISAEQMETIIQAGAAAPCGSNAQMWAFVAVRDPKRIMALRSLSPGIIGSPAAVVVLCLDHSHPNASLLEKGDITPYIDIGAAMQNILLAANELGLAGCPVASFHHQAIASFLKLPAHLQPVLLIVMGTPKFIPKAPEKRPLSEIYYQESYHESD